MVHRRLAALCVAAVAASILVALSPAEATEGEWSPLQEAGGSTLAVALDSQSTALVSVGGPDEATIYDQRRNADGTLGPRTEVTTVEDAEYCRPVEAVTALGNVAVAVECQATTGLEDPPTRLVELVWTGDDGWVWHVLPEGELGSLDYSPAGSVRRVHQQQPVRPAAPRDQLPRRPRLGLPHPPRAGSTGDDLVAAISDAGNVVVLRGAGVRGRARLLVRRPAQHRDLQLHDTEDGRSG